MALKKLFNKSFPNSKNIKVVLPRDAYFLFIDKCNARCSMCEDDFFNHSGRAITLDKFKIIARNIHLENMKTTVLSGGEPLLNKDLLAIISFINRHYPRIEVVICTNAIALTQRIAEELLQRNVHSLNISVNAGTRETYKLLTQVDCFDRVIENIRKFQELRIETGKQPKLNLSFVASRKNIGELSVLIRLAASIGAKSVSSTYCRFFPIAQRLSLAINKDNLLEDNDSLYFHQEMSDRYFKEAAGLAKQLGIDFAHEPLFSENTSRVKCQYPFTAILIGFDGEVYPCCGGDSIFKEKISSGMYDFGNALKQPIEDFWYYDSHKALRYSALNLEKPAVPECGVCLDIMKWKGHTQKAHVMEWDELKHQSIDFDLIKHIKN